MEKRYIKDLPLGTRYRYESGGPVRVLLSKEKTQTGFGRCAVWGGPNTSPASQTQFDITATENEFAQLQANVVDCDSLIADALELIVRFGGTDGLHHLQWVVDQVARALTGCPKNGNDSYGENQQYLDLVAETKAGEDGPETYDWETGIAP